MANTEVPGITETAVSRNKDQILITLATGKTGYLTTKNLLQDGYSVKIFVRSKSDKANELQRLGAEVIVGTFDNINDIKRALTGVSTVYYCYPLKRGMVDDVKLFIKAALASGIKAVVFMGQRIAEFADTGSVLTNNTREAYNLFQESGLNVVYFIPGYFADNNFPVTEFVLQLGIFPSSYGKGKNPWISNEDMGRTIAALLKNPVPYFGTKLFPTGSKSISAVEMASIFSKVRGSKVRVIESPEWLFLKAGFMLGKEFGVDAFAIVQANLYNRQLKMNRFDIEPTGVVKELTGREPEDFETITRRYFDESPYKKRSLKNWLSAFNKFLFMPFTPIPSTRALAALNS